MVVGVGGSGRMLLVSEMAFFSGERRVGRLKFGRDLALMWSGSSSKGSELGVGPLGDGFLDCTGEPDAVG